MEQKVELDYSKISDIEIENIDYSDYPDFCDAYISDATYDGEPMSNEQLEQLNYDTSFVYDQVIKRIF
jgi:hypothetical protein